MMLFPENLHVLKSKSEAFVVPSMTNLPVSPDLRGRGGLETKDRETGNEFPKDTEL